MVFYFLCLGTHPFSHFLLLSDCIFSIMIKHQYFFDLSKLIFGKKTKTKTKIKKNIFKSKTLKIRVKTNLVHFLATQADWGVEPGRSSLSTSHWSSRQGPCSMGSKHSLVAGQSSWLLFKHSRHLDVSFEKVWKIYDFLKVLKVQE